MGSCGHQSLMLRPAPRTPPVCEAPPVRLPALSPAKKTDPGGESKVCLLSFSRSLLIMWNIGVLGCCAESSPPPLQLTDLIRR